MSYKIIALLLLLGKVAALCTNTCDDTCTLYCAGCKEVALCNLVTPVVQAINLIDSTLNSSAAVDLIGFCNEITFEKKYQSETYTVSCHTSACATEYCTPRSGCVSPPDTSCDVSCQVCRDDIVCDILIDRLSIMANTTYNNSLIYELSSNLHDEIVDQCTPNSVVKKYNSTIISILIVISTLKNLHSRLVGAFHFGMLPKM